jgi:hypothetical protein
VSTHSRKAQGITKIGMMTKGTTIIRILTVGIII